MSVRVAWTRKRDEVGLPGWILLLPVRDAYQLLTCNHRTTPSQGALFFCRMADRLQAKDQFRTSPLLLDFAAGPIILLLGSLRSMVVPG
jgi:hypothetical protein